MESNTATLSATTKALYISLALILFSLVTMFMITDYSKMNQVSWIGYVILIGGIIWATMSFVKSVNGNTTFGNAFGYGFKIGALITLIMIAYSLLAALIIFPEMKDLSMEAARKQLEAQGKLGDSQIDEALEMTKKFFVPFLIAGTLGSYLILSAIGAAIGAGLAKKNPNYTPIS